MFIKYEDIDGDSNISSYEIESESISVEFKDGSIYTYSYLSPGKEDVERMKELAERDDGLNSYIMRNCRKNILKSMLMVNNSIK